MAVPPSTSLYTFRLSWLARGALPEVEPVSEYTPARVPALVIETEPVTESPIFIAEALKMAPEPERVIESVPEAKALDAIAVGDAVKFAKVPPTAATASTETAARLRRIFDSGRFLSIERVSPFGLVDTLTIGSLRMGWGAKPE